MATIDCWTGREARLLRAALRLTVRAFAEDLGVSPRTISKWEAGGVDHVPRAELQQALDTVLARATPDARARFDRRAAALDAADPAADRPAGTVPDRSRSSPGAPFPVPSSWWSAHVVGERPPNWVTEELEVSAEESSRFLTGAARVVSDDVLEQLHDEVEWFAREYLTRPPYALLRLLARRRRDVFALVDARPHPRYLTDLYRIAGRLTALMAHASSDLGHAHAASSHARSALLCADYSGDTRLTAYVRWVESNTALWQGRADLAADIALTALDATDNDEERLRLASQAARAYGILNNPHDGQRALDMATQLRDRLSTEQRPPGVFSFQPGKAAYYASEAYLALGGAENTARAVAAAAEGLVLLDTDRDARTCAELEAACRLDLAAAHLALHETDHATGQITQVLQLPAEKRTVPILGRVRNTHHALRHSDATRTTAVIELCDTIETFLAYPATRELPGETS